MITGMNNPTERMFKSNRIMEELLAYILEHIEEEISLKQLCRLFDINERTLLRKTKEIFGIPCERFIGMLRMREAAKELLSEEGASAKTLAERYGFSGMSAFSKAFKRELGVSPRLFQKEGKSVPDMPLPKTVNGRKLFFRYLKTEDFRVYGYKVPLIDGARTDLLEQCAYPLEHGSQYLDLQGNKDQIGFWWGGSENELFYVLGYKVYSDYDIPEDAQVFLFEGSDYAVFSVETSDRLEDTLKTHRMMVYYAMKVWKEINHKTGNTMGYTYEVFGRNYTYLYLPLWKGMPEEEQDVMGANAGIDDWVPYIDQHIKDNLSLTEIAAHFNYSRRHFCRVFKNYFAYSAAEYIRKERLYLAARELKTAQGEKERTKRVKEYHFADYESFRKSFIEEFHTEPENYQEVPFHIPNLAQYYSKHKDQIKVSYVELEDIKMAGRIIQARNASEDVQDNLDIPDLAAYWMRHDPYDTAGTGLASSDEGDRDRVALWLTDEETGSNEYILGPVLNDFTHVPEGYKAIRLPAGIYAEIQSLEENDEKNMSEYYRLLSRCAYGWIKEYRYRVNLDRISFVRYVGHKLYFYVPLYE